MEKNEHTRTDEERSIYQITVEGRVEDSWSDWFSGMEITSRHDIDRAVITNFYGPVADQAALRGLLNKLWDLNLKILFVKKIDLLNDDHRHQKNIDVTSKTNEQKRRFEK